MKVLAPEETGHGLIELLLVLPLMLLIILGGIDVSHSIDNSQAAVMLAREGANRARRVCFRATPVMHLDQTCMQRLLIDVGSTLNGARMLVTLYTINDDDEVELTDFSGSYIEADPVEDSKWSSGRLVDESEMVQQALEFRSDESTRHMIKRESFVIAVSEVFYENSALSSLHFVTMEGYEVTIF